MMTKEEYKNTNWKMTYEQYQKCYCTECDKVDCIHRNAYKPECEKRITKGQEKSCSLFFMKRRTCDVTVWRKIRFRQKSLGRNRHIYE